MFYVLSVLSVSLWFLLAAPVSAQSPAPDQATYAGWVREAFAAAQRGDRLGLEDTAARLVATSSVRLPGGASSAVDNGWLREALKQSEPDMAAVAARLGAILDALAQPDSAAPADARARLAQILDRPPFKQQEIAPPSWWTAFLEWVFRAIESLLRPFGRAVSASGDAIAWVIGIIGLILLAGVLAYLLRGLRRGLVADARADDADPAAHLTARTALDQAGGLARGGDYRTAVRYMYLSALLWLDERNILRYDRALTNREYLDRVRDNPALRARLAPIVDTFDRVWYGHVSIDAESFAAYQRQVEELRDDKMTR